jgi:hypothetical protein
MQSACTKDSNGDDGEPARATPQQLETGDGLTSCGPVGFRERAILPALPPMGNHVLHRTLTLEGRHRAIQKVTERISLEETSENQEG